MILGILWGLVYICILALVIYLAFYVIENVVGLVIPPEIKKIIWIIVLLIALIILVAGLTGAVPTPSLGLALVYSWPRNDEAVFAVPMLCFKYAAFDGYSEGELKVLVCNVIAGEVS
jgi:hypothetical protein